MMRMRRLDLYAMLAAGKRAKYKTSQQHGQKILFHTGNLILR
jgi:hypothetical protein